VCGEGGEYESLTLNCPLFKRRIVMYVRVRCMRLVTWSGRRHMVMLAQRCFEHCVR
jgi:diphthamide synthase (EF-2-diphthine--ammonia ligase)